MEWLVTNDEEYGELGESETEDTTYAGGSVSLSE